MAEVSELVKSIGDSLGAVFRHLLPGVLILGAVGAARPSWFDRVDVAKGEWLIVLGVLATSIGNVWFVVHRYVVQQVIDLFFWRFNAEGGPKREDGKYAAGIADQVWKFFSAAGVSEKIRDHVRFRTSSVVLMYIAGEVAVLAAMLAEQNSVLSPNRRWLVVVGVVILLFAIWQNYLVRRIEGRVANRNI